MFQFIYKKAENVCTSLDQTKQLLTLFKSRQWDNMHAAGFPLMRLLIDAGFDRKRPQKTVDALKRREKKGLQDICKVFYRLFAAAGSLIFNS